MAPVVVGVLAVVTAVPAWWPAPPVELGPLDRTGQIIGEAAEVDDIAEVSVIDYDAGNAQVRTVQVRLVDGLWRISSKDNYPADNEGKVGEAIGALLNQQYGRSIEGSGSGDAWLAQFGLGDPSQQAEGSGTHVTLSTAGGKKVVDVIIGDQAAVGTGRYVRLAGESAVYTAPITRIPSTRFIDWVERDLLKVQTSNIDSFIVDRHTVRLEQDNPVDLGQSVQFSGADEAWQSTATPVGQQVNKEAVDNLLSRLASLRITDLSPRTENPQIMGVHGFFATQDGNVFGKEGALRVTDALGFTYHCFFGEVAVQSSEADAESANPDRFMAIWVTYLQDQDSALPSRPPQPEPAAADADEATRAAAAKAIEGYGERLTQYQSDLQSHLQGRSDKVAQLNQRFGEYFFVVSGADFSGLHPELEALFEPLAIDNAAGIPTGN
jgi:hypothetical protein